MAGIELNRKLLLERPQKIADDAGGFDVSWIAVGSLWASIERRSAREANSLDAPVSEVKYRILVRAAPVGSSMRPKPDQRLREGQRAFVIDAVVEAVDTAMYLECWAREEEVQ